MAYEIYQSRFTGAKIDEYLADVPNLKDKVSSLETNSATKTELNDYEKKTDLATTLANYDTSDEVDSKIEDAQYELPKASTTTLGGVKIDGTTITIDENGVISGASSIDKIEDIGDVELTNISDGQALLWDATNSQWVNGDVESGGGSINGDLYFSYDDYSEEEQVIGRWKDGKPIYRITIPNINKTIPVSTWVDITIPTNSYENIVNITLLSDVSNGSTHYMYGEGNFKNNSTLTFCTYLGGNRRLDTLILEYTKTTDAENSFTPDMIKQIPAIEEVTDEDVEEVFTWQ